MTNGFVDDVVQRAAGSGFAYDVVVDGKKYGHGFIKPKVAKGDRVQFVVEQKGSFFNIKAGSLKPWEPKDDPEDTSQKPVETRTSDQKGAGGAGVQVPPQSAARAVVDRDSYWANKEARDIQKERKYEQREQEKQERITFEACRKQAMDFVQLMLGAEACFFKKMDKPADRFDYLRKMIEDTHRRFYAEATQREAYLGNKPITDLDLTVNPDPPVDGEWK